ncbi:hypothetical protein FE784_33260 [Paenibacillus hemerocallicola]|uniref:Uncharacterized protein n=1 Tax=Paenibacillus hemerocallicola TaxID=1172614 RepID=A0A5C4SYT7_9BACL|nr:hypothetical protein [Paenibacillus hemerocallicola]TNJ61931.1 hypothetical protein FE784_33260 [Paenibacillus hemerocallicola]
MHVPNWSQVRIMLEKSQPKAIFKHHADVGQNQVIKVIAKNETMLPTKIIDIDCAFAPKT